MTPFVPWSLNKRTLAPTRIIFAGLLALLHCASVFALDLGDNMQIHGFASQAFTLTNNNQYFGETTDGSLGYTELGINGSYRPLPSLLLSAQALSRRAGEVDDGNIRLDYGFADYSVISNQDRRWGVRAGRIKNPFGFYNETRDVAFTRPTIFLPQGIYFDQVRPLVLSSDGGSLYGEERTAIGDFTLRLNAVRLDADNTDTELAFLGFKTKGHLENDVSFVGQLLYEYDAGRLRAAVSVVDGTLDYNPSAQDFLTDGSIHITPVVLSLQYNTEDWSFTTEFLREPVKYKDLGFAAPDQSITAQSYFVQGSYRFHPGWEVLLRYDVFYPDKDDKTGRRFVGSPVPSSRAFAKDWTAGLRWDISPYTMVRAEFHRVDGTAWLPLQDNPDPTQWVRKWNMFSLQLSVRF